MRINKVLLENGSTALLVDEFLDEQHIKIMHDICDAFSLTSNNWRQAETTGPLANRYLYERNTAEWQAVLAHINSRSTLDQLELAIGKPLTLCEATIWADLAGLGPLTPHKELDGTYMAQVYITHKCLPEHGTTIYNDNKEIVIQLPYRDNFSWFFDDGTTIMHGRAKDVPADFTRFTLQLWFATPT